jgi:hypothetical protein
VSLEDIDIAEWRIGYARYWTSVMHQLSDILAARPHPIEPRARDGAERRRLVAQPHVDRRLPFDCSFKPKHREYCYQPVGIKPNCMSKVTWS